MNLKQVFDTLDKAVQALVSSDLRLPNRLDLAITILSEITEKDMPPDCRKQFNQLTGSIQVYQKSDDRNELHAQLALEIYALLKQFISVTSGGSGWLVM